MAINAQGEPGRIRLFYDFYGEDSIAGTAALRPLGPFSVGGQGSEDIDAGVPTIAGVLSGAGRITTTNEVDHTTMVGTQAAFDVALSGTLVLETRVQMENLDTKEVFIGFSDIAPGTLSIQTDVVHGCNCNDYEHSFGLRWFLACQQNLLMPQTGTLFTTVVLPVLLQLLRH
jgi:hypothetical protein